MTISSHLTPEPERRLWAILESLRHSCEWTDKKIAALCALAAAQLAFLRMMGGSGTLSLAGGIALLSALLLGLLAFSPLTQLAKPVVWLEPPKDKGAGDCLLAAEDIAKYAHGELVHRLDKYLGGGVTATQYHEDLVGLVLIHARVAARKQYLFRVVCALAVVGQLGPLGQLLGR